MLDHTNFRIRTLGHRHCRNSSSDKERQFHAFKGPRKLTSARMEPSTGIPQHCAASVACGNTRICLICQNSWVSLHYDTFCIAFIWRMGWQSLRDSDNTLYRSCSLNIMPIATVLSIGFVAPARRFSGPDMIKGSL